jgi:hypothetical protein
MAERPSNSGRSGARRGSGLRIDLSCCCDLNEMACAVIYGGQRWRLKMTIPAGAPKTRSAPHCDRSRLNKQGVRFAGPPAKNCWLLVACSGRVAARSRVTMLPAQEFEPTMPGVTSVTRSAIRTNIRTSAALSTPLSSKLYSGRTAPQRKEKKLDFSSFPYPKQFSSAPRACPAFRWRNDWAKIGRLGKSRPFAPLSWSGSIGCSGRHRRQRACFSARASSCPAFWIGLAAALVRRPGAGRSSSSKAHECGT